MIKAKEIHYYYSYNDIEVPEKYYVYVYYKACKEAIESGLDIVRTTIPSFLSWSCGERLFIHCNGQVKEIIKCVDAREAQNVEKMFLGGCFGMIDEE